MDAVGFARGRSHAIQPWPDQEAHDAKDRAANEALELLLLFFQEKFCGADVRRIVSSPRPATTAISQLSDLSRGCRLDS